MLVLLFNGIAGLYTPNEDLELIRQRLLRCPRKPWWWHRVSNQIGLDNDAKLCAVVGEFGGGPATGSPVDNPAGSTIYPIESRMVLSS